MTTLELDDVTYLPGSKRCLKVLSFHLPPSQEGHQRRPGQQERQGSVGQECRSQVCAGSVELIRSNGRKERTGAKL